ncbi:MAG: ATP-binding protein [Desulfosalsimonadaceae bacterium]
MKCSVCKESAFIKLERHNSAFCRQHYHEHVLRQVQRTIRRYRMFAKTGRILLGVSGGKDSMGAWKILTGLGYTVAAVHINNGFGEYSRQSEEKVRSFAARQEVPVYVYSFQELMGCDFDTACRLSRKPACSLCGTIKRYYLNRLALEHGCDTVATGHNLDDECAVLLSNVLAWHIGYMARQAPVLEGEPGMARRVKPLVMLTDREMAKFVEMHGIGVAGGTCPHSRGATSLVYKELLNSLQDRSHGVKAQFYFGFLKQMKDALPDPEHKEEAGEPVNRCPECGYKTIKPDKCFICSLKEKIAAEAEQ